MKSTFLHEYETKTALAEFLLKADKLSMDQMCSNFEQEFAKVQGRKYAILYNSGSSANLALIQSLKNLGNLKNGDNVGFSALTWSTNTMPLIQLGLNPIPVDCLPKTLNVMSQSILDRLQEIDLQALFLTNALGFVGDIPEIKSLCEDKGILLIEDNCESLGTETVQGKAGNFGLGSTFSFFVAHHMSTIEGGMVCTDDPELAQMLQIVRANGWDRNLSAPEQIQLRQRHKISSEFEAKYTFYDLAFNFRPTEITGFLGLNQMKYLDENIKVRESNFNFLNEFIQKNEDLIALRRDHITRLSPFAMPIVCKSPELRSSYLAQFSGAGIEVRPMIAGNIQLQPFFKKYVSRTFALPGSDFLNDNAFYCGNYPELTRHDLETISSCLTKY